MANIKSQSTRSRPISISIICIVLFIGSISALMIGGNPSFFEELFPGYTYSLANKLWMILSGITGVLCAIYLWKMKKLAGIATIGFQIICMFMGLIFWGKINTYDLSGLIVIIFIFIHLKKMT